MPFFANITHENVFCQHSNAIYFLFLYSAFGKQHFGINLAKKRQSNQQQTPKMDFRTRYYQRFFYALTIY